MPRAWDKEKICVPDRIRTLTSETPGGRSIHLSYGELIESEAIYQGVIFLFMWLAKGTEILE